MYALLMSFLVSVSVDCPIIIQLALDMDIKYTNTEYFVQYEKDCCLGVGVICENNRVVELHWGFARNYNKVTYPLVTFPPNLRVLDFQGNYKSMTIKTLPKTLKVLDTISTSDIRFELNAFPNLVYLGLGDIPTGMSRLPRLPDSLEYIDLRYYDGLDILPLNSSNLKELYCSYESVDRRTFPNLPETIEVVELDNADLYGPISTNFKSLRKLTLFGRDLSGNVTISSPNITRLFLYQNSFDNLLLTYPEQVTDCNLDGNYFDATNVDVLGRLPNSCHYLLKSPKSPDCDNVIEFAKQTNMHLTNINFFRHLSTMPNCCDDSYGIIKCSGNRISELRFSFSSSYFNFHLNGTINTTLLPDSLSKLSLDGNQFAGPFPNLTSLVNLRELNLEKNKFEGSIMNLLPDSLTTLSIGFNKLNGTIPNLKSLGHLSASQNFFTNVENNLIGTMLQNIDISYNQIKGTIDLSNYVPSLFNVFYFQNNFIDKIMVNSVLTNFQCDISFNNIYDFTNLASCTHDIQRYTSKSVVHLTRVLNFLVIFQVKSSIFNLMMSILLDICHNYQKDWNL
eukprot:NODE_262_length_11424_cov_0.885828.p1 type:complete len:565 gc:universal NODE_262_length_11424_cov_0.885828:1233-2927(+)